MKFSYSFRYKLMLIMRHIIVTNLETCDLTIGLHLYMWTRDGMNISAILLYKRLCTIDYSNSTWKATCKYPFLFTCGNVFFYIYHVKIYCMITAHTHAPMCHTTCNKLCATKTDCQLNNVGLLQYCVVYVCCIFTNTSEFLFLSNLYLVKRSVNVFWDEYRVHTIRIELLYTYVTMLTMFIIWKRFLYG